MRVRLRGWDRVIATLDTMQRVSRRETAGATRELAGSVLRDVSGSRPGAGVPRDTGALANSGVATGPDGAGVSRVTFGGAAAPYALIVHEMATPHDTGESRYLTRGVDRAEADGEPVKALKGAADEVIRSGKSA